ncbi:MAG TPA: hypothetical protein VGN95_18710 [Pyrinomonadaceae bacterium]|nr:hypothetical protein [Pyrinomonadaceae bacterium]
MLETLNLASFSEHLNTKFRIHPDDSTVVETELIEAVDDESTPSQERFSLIFRGPHQPYLAQSLYRIEHDKMGTLNLFLVPVGKNEDGFEYQAVFNRLHKVK